MNKELIKQQIANNEAAIVECQARGVYYTKMTGICVAHNRKSMATEWRKNTRENNKRIKFHKLAIQNLSKQLVA